MFKAERMSNEPKKASADIRKKIQEALRDEARRFLDINSSSYQYLTLWDLSEEGFYTELADGLTQDRLFLKPKSKPNAPQRYQCVLDFPEFEELPAILVHVTLSPQGDPPRVKVAVHPSDTARTLPTISITQTSNEDQSSDS